jgi:HPt (histidine-containing phosphotransfer) domain-containing protein
MNCLDVTCLKALVGDDPATVSALLETYLRSLEGSAASLCTGMSEKDPDKVRAAAHRIKSPSLSVGAIPLGELCQSLERAAGDAKWDRVATLYAGFAQAVDGVQRAARAHIATAGAER